MLGKRKATAAADTSDSAVEPSAEPVGDDEALHAAFLERLQDGLDAVQCERAIDRPIESLADVKVMPADKACPRAAEMHVYAEGNDVFDTMLYQADMVTFTNKFHTMQLLETDAMPRQYYTWNRSGRVGEDREVKTALAGPKSLDVARADFTKAFQSKTKNAWDDRHSFVRHAGKFIPHEHDECGDAGDAAGCGRGQRRTLSGIGGTPLLPLPAACALLRPHLAGVDAAVEASLAAAARRPHGGLSLDEAAAVHMYSANTNGLFRALNTALRQTDVRGATRAYVGYLRLLGAALGKMTAVERALYRGVPDDLSSSYREGEEVVWWAVSSCTTNRSIATEYMSDCAGAGAPRTLFCVLQHSAVPIRHLSAYQREEEFVLQPGTRLTVQRVHRDDASNLVEVELRRPRLVS